MARPRTVSLEPEEMIKMGEEMIDWVTENDPLHLSHWYSIEKGILEKEWKTMIEREEFRGYYEIAMRIIGQKYLDKNSRVREGVSQRWQRVYFKDLAQEEDDRLRFEASLRAKEGEEVNEEIKEKQDQILSQLSSMQASSKAERESRQSNTSDTSESMET